MLEVEQALLAEKFQQLLDNEQQAVKTYRTLLEQTREGEVRAQLEMLFEKNNATSNWRRGCWKSWSKTAFFLRAGPGAGRFFLSRRFERLYFPDPQRNRFFYAPEVNEPYIERLPSRCARSRAISASINSSISPERIRSRLKLAPSWPSPLRRWSVQRFWG